MINMSYEGYKYEGDGVGEMDEKRQGDFEKINSSSGHSPLAGKTPGIKILYRHYYLRAKQNKKYPRRMIYINQGNILSIKKFKTSRDIKQ